MSAARDTAGVIAPPPLIALAAVVLGLLLDWLLPAYVLSVLLTLTERIVIGVFAHGAGLGFGVSGDLRVSPRGTHVEPWKPTSALVTGGIFRCLRNPMYVGMTGFLIGLAIALASDWMLVMSVVLALTIHFGVVKREERYLEAKFGDAYRAYRARVPRYGWPPAGAA